MCHDFLEYLFVEPILTGVVVLFILAALVQIIKAFLDHRVKMKAFKYSLANAGDSDKHLAGNSSIKGPWKDTKPK